MQLFSVPGSDLQAFFCVDPVSPLTVDDQPFGLQQAVQDQVTINRLLSRQLFQPLELVVLGCKLAQALCLVHFKTGVFAAPFVKGPGGNAQLAANVPRPWRRLRAA